MKPDRIHASAQAVVYALIGLAIFGGLLVGLVFAGMLPVRSAHAPGISTTTTPTISQTSTSTATPTPTKPAPVVYRVTYYGLDFQGGLVYCGYGPFDLNDPTTAASGEGGPPCHTRLMLCSDTACQEVTIKDACGGCGPYHLDLSQAAWEVLGRPSHVEAQLLQAAIPESPQVEEQLLQAAIPESPPATTIGGNPARLPVPPGTSVRNDGCASDGYCTWYNYYACWTHEIVLQGDEPTIRLYHERAHAHQAYTVYGDSDCPPDDRDLESWLSTAEAAAFGRAIQNHPWPWGTISTNTGLLEDYAETVAWYYLDPAHLREVSPARYEWAIESLP